MNGSALTLRNALADGQISLFARLAPPRAPVDVAAEVDQTRDAYWRVFDLPPGRGRAEQMRRLLEPLSGSARHVLHNTPRPRQPGEPIEFDAGLPLAVAASRDMHDVLAQILAEPTTVVWLGDRQEGDAALTASYWGALYGAAKSLELLYARNPSLRDALRALESRVDPQTVRWLKQHNVTPEELAPAMLQAVLRDSAVDVSSLVRLGGANALARWAPGQPHEPAGDLGERVPTAAPPTACSLLTLAVHMGYYRAAARLLELGAKPEVTPFGDTLASAVRGGQLELVRQLFANGASGTKTHLAAALELPANQRVDMLMCLYESGVRPATSADAGELLATGLSLRPRPNALCALLAQLQFECDLTRRDGVGRVALAQAARTRDALAAMVREAPAVWRADMDVWQRGDINLQTDVGPAGRTLLKRSFEQLRQTFVAWHNPVVDRGLALLPWRP